MYLIFIFINKSYYSLLCVSIWRIFFFLVICKDNWILVKFLKTIGFWLNSTVGRNMFCHFENP